MCNFFTAYQLSDLHLYLPIVILSSRVYRFVYAFSNELIISIYHRENNFNDNKEKTEKLTKTKNQREEEEEEEKHFS